MDTPGITVRPIITLDGEHEVNEVFSDSRRLAAAKFVVSRASELIAEQSPQLHGGIGMTREYSKVA